MNKEKNRGDYRSRLTKDQIFTIPNILSYLRIALIPLIIWLYIGRSNYTWALVVILISSATDVADGFIARRFNMITDFGKMIDPVADKMTQLAILICLISRFPLILLPFSIMLVKEIVSFFIRLRLFQKANRVYGAAWHGKANTVILYAMLCAHIVFPYSIKGTISTATILLSSAFMLFSFVMYTISAIKSFKEAKEEYQKT